MDDFTQSPGTFPVNPAPLPTPEPVQLRDIHDVGSIRKNIYANVLGGIKKLPPIQSGNYQLEFDELDYADPETVPLKKQNRAILRGETLSRRLTGTIRLRDKAGNVVDQRRSVIARVPILTEGGTFILNGTKYTLSHQMRLRPGIYTRVKDNGITEAHFNALPGKGSSHRITIDPETGVFKMQIQQADIPLMPLLRAMGADNKKLEAAWGPEILNANIPQDKPALMEKYFKKLVRLKDGEQVTDKAKRVVEELLKTEVDPDVNAYTLKKPYDRASLEQMLDTTSKIIRVNRGEEEPDDRDSAAFQQFFGPEDLFAEQINYVPRILKPLVWRAGAKGNLDPIQSGALTRHLESTFLSTGLGAPVEEVSPMEVLDQITRVTRMGRGGLPSIDSIPDSSRSVQPSHYGFIDPVRTPESLKIGVDVRFASGVKKGSDGQIYSPFRNVKTGQIQYLSPKQVAGKAIPFPGEMQSDKKWIRILQNGKISYGKKDQVEFEPSHGEKIFNHLSNLVLGKSAVKPQRVAMGSRMITQALSLANPEAPLVRSEDPDKANTSFVNEFGRVAGAVRSDKEGQVVFLDDDEIHIQTADGSIEKKDLYNNYLYNRKSFIHNTPLVKLGDKVKPGQVLAKSNYTDDEGNVAVGANFRAAYIPMADNFEDAIAISESAAKRLASQHAYMHSTEFDSKAKRGKKPFLSLFPTEFSKSQLESLDDDGIVKKGTVVNYGDPLILKAARRDVNYQTIGRNKQQSFASDSEIWDHENSGVVVGVEKTRKGATVAIKSINQTQIADKLAGTYGDKSVISQIIPDEDMPVDETGKPVEVLINPLGISTRGNPIQIYEAVLGKIARKTGKPYLIKDFEGRDWPEFVEKEMLLNNVKDLETLTDPRTGRKIPNVLVGERFLMKLHHEAEKKAQGRSISEGYTSEGIPARGAYSGSKRVGMLELNALLSHGAYGVASDASAVRGQKNTEYWNAFLRGQTPPDPTVPPIYQKFINSFRVAGINPVRQGNRIRLQAMTDRDVDFYAGDAEIENPETVDFRKQLQPIPGGLFDFRKTGGNSGNRWGKITLDEPIPNPSFEEPIRRVLDLTGPKFEEILAGKAELPNGGSGPEAIRNALDGIDLKKEISNLEQDLKTASKSKRDSIVKKLRYLRAADKLEIHPRDWMITKVPVLPPVFRPVSVMGSNKEPLIADLNYLYRDIFEARDNLREIKKSSQDVAEERMAVYQSVKALAGLDDPVNPKNKEKNIKGVLDVIFGNSSKYGVLQRKLLGSAVDLVGRNVITPDANLDMDSIGIPENQAWDVYRPHIIRRLVRSGMDPIVAAQITTDKSEVAKRAMLQEMEERPVIASRAPVLHRYGIMAFKPKLYSGNALRISPLVVKGLGADFDGDAMNWHVPQTERAVKDALDKMLPSKNLLSISDFQAHQQPINEYLSGLFYGSALADEKVAPRVFRSTKDVLEAWRNGEIKGNQKIIVLDEKA